MSWKIHGGLKAGAGDGTLRPKYQALSPVHLSSGLAVAVQLGWPRYMYRDPLTEVGSEAVGFLVLLTPVVVGEFVYFLPTT